MRPAGLREVELAKRDGRWAAAYDSPRTSSLPPDFMTALNGNERANTFFATLNKRNTYAIYYRLQSAKRLATREKRIQDIVAMLASGKTFYP